MWYLGGVVMKKYLIFFITILFILLAAGCGSDSSDGKQGNSNISADSSSEGYSDGSLDPEVFINLHVGI